MAAYRRFLNLLKKWPLDETKGDKDLGLFLRKLLQEQFPQGEGSKVTEAVWAKKLDGLDKIVQNKHSSEHPLPSNFMSATGLSAEECNRALSREFLKTLATENNKGFFARVLLKEEK
ncbi:ubiquinol-cytochrome-c reductase complex assembly factor 2 [Neocloeon triangulifer]|uniref:ubiquinol-cytochrome-c reductase complex assembly factor 2 n=1 Tax=Neocloeon triangulifer TaxID=2078957 RepID=UPI00286F07C8|nr:ubiquinol-cytochrome-c reductase complex assembly factor 2 [Neocloeon triangulifer]XP_059484286.1 ubiquinol-cytochrome-c reductase complex assembly factor 2 [Neocloeon triangulifer]